MPGNVIKHRAGFTLIEMIIVIVVVGVIFAIGGLVLGRAFESYDLTREATYVGWQGRVALERIARELRDIRSATAVDLTITATNISFVDANANSVCFYQSGTQLMRSDGTCGGATAQPLADNLITGGLGFGYFDNAGATTAIVNAVYYVAVTVSIREGDISESYRVSVQPRRF
jgi:prepilin-type N-terminal cleavage/methylation domain-containing protein